MRIRDDELDPLQAAADEALEERAPQRDVFAQADVHAEHFADPIGPHAVRDDDRHRHHAVVFPHMFVAGVHHR